MSAISLFPLRKMTFHWVLVQKSNDLSLSLSFLPSTQTLIDKGFPSLSKAPMRCWHSVLWETCTALTMQHSYGKNVKGQSFVDRQRNQLIIFPIVVVPKRRPLIKCSLYWQNIRVLGLFWGRSMRCILYLLVIVVSQRFVWVISLDAAEEQFVYLLQYSTSIKLSISALPFSSLP